MVAGPSGVSLGRDDRRRGLCWREKEFAFIHTPVLGVITFNPYRFRCSLLCRDLVPTFAGSATDRHFHGVAATQVQGGAGGDRIFRWAFLMGVSDDFGSFLRAGCCTRTMLHLAIRSGSILYGRG